MRKLSYPLVSSCIIVLLLALNAALIIQNRDLKARFSQPPPEMQVKAGAIVPALEGYDPHGEKLAFPYGRDPRKTIVFVFSPTCSFCEENWPNWRQVAEHLDITTVRPVAVDVSSSASLEFAASHGLADMPLIVKVEPKSLISYRFRLTPQTILIDSHGRVEKIWSGVLTSEQVEEAAALVGRPVESSRDIQSKEPGVNSGSQQARGVTPRI